MKIIKLTLVLLLSLTITKNYAKERVNIVSSIYPIQQITNYIYGDETNLLVKTSQSPHNYLIKPSDVSIIDQADLFIWVGPTLLPQIKSYVAKRKGITLNLLQISDIAYIKEDEDHGHSHGHTQNVNPHIWLSTENAKIIAASIYHQLVKLNPDNQKKYKDNLDLFNQEMDQLHQYISNNLEPIRNKPYYIYHDAYAYFEKEYNIKHSGLVRIDPSKSLRSKQILDLRKEIKTSKSGCIFQEPQFSSNTIEQLIAGTSFKAEFLDPIGYDINQTGFSSILKNIADNMRNCLQK